MERKYIICTTREWDPNDNRFKHTISYVEKSGQKEIYDNPSTETGKKLLNIARRIMGDIAHRKITLEVIE